jgi:hypothetical protein
MRIGKQCSEPEDILPEMRETSVFDHQGRPRAAGEYRDEETQTPDENHELTWYEGETSLTTCATYGSYGRHSFLPRYVSCEYSYFIVSAAAIIIFYIRHILTHY